MAQEINGDLHIVILDRGFVLVGKTEVDGDWLIIRDASVVRRWGTSNGLGELALEGPKRNTKLDPAGEVRSPLRALIGLIHCEPAKWAR